MQNRLSIYQIYINNGCRYGFFVRRNTWESSRYAKVVEIEFPKEDELTKGDPILGATFVKLEADWLIGGIVEIDSGGNNCWEQVDPLP